MLEESSNTVAAYWSNVLKTIEPTVVQIFHHIEAVFVSATKQVIRTFYQNIVIYTRFKRGINTMIFGNFDFSYHRVFIRETTRAHAIAVLRAHAEYDSGPGQVLQRSNTK